MAESKVEGLEFLLPFQGRLSCIVVSNGVSAAEELGRLANDNGFEKASQGNIAYVVKNAFFARPKSQADFFVKRDAAFKRAAALAKRELDVLRLEDEGSVCAESNIKPEIVVLSQAEGWENGSNRYEVAVLSVKSCVLGHLYSEIRAGNCVVGPVGKSIEESVRSYRGIICGSRLLFDEMGCPWFIGGTSRFVAQKKMMDSASRKDRGITDLFARMYALTGGFGGKFTLPKVSGMQQLTSDVVISEMGEGFRYYSVYGISSKDVSLACKAFLQEEHNGEKDEIICKPKNGKGFKSSDGNIGQKPLKESIFSENTESKEKGTVCEDADEGEERKVIHETNVLSVEGVRSRPVQGLVELCKVQGWNIGWDVAKSRIIQLGCSEFHTAKEESDDLFFKKRYIAMRKAFLNAVIKISCLLSFDVRNYSDGLLCLTVNGATMIKFSEGYDPISRRYCVATLVTWSKTLERIAKAIQTGDELNVKPGQLSFRTWLDRQNPMSIGMAQKYVDQNGICWAVSAMPFFWSDSLDSAARSDKIDYVESSLSEMLLLGCRATVIVPQKDYDHIKNRMQSLDDERIIDECLEKMNVEINKERENLKGVREMVDVSMIHESSERKARVFVYATNVNLVRNAKE